MKGLLRTEHHMGGGQISFCSGLAAGILALFLPESFMLGVRWGLTLLPPVMSLVAAQNRLKCRWNRYLLMLPYSRRTVVLSRYLYYLTAALGSAVWMLLLSSLFGTLRHGDMSEDFLICSAVRCIRLMLFTLALTLPLSVLMDRFEKQWLYGLGIALFPFLFFGFIYLSLTGLEPEMDITAFILLKCGIIHLLILAVSFGISLAAYCGGFRRKEADA